jgi:multidrug resistance efflux pump
MGTRVAEHASVMSRPPPSVCLVAMVAAAASLACGCKEHVTASPHDASPEASSAHPPELLALSPTLTYVYSPVSGIVTRVATNVDDHVAAGDPLAFVSCPDLGSARAALRKAEADLVAAKRGLARFKQLHAMIELTEREYDAVLDSYARTESEYRRTKASYERLEQLARAAHSDGSDEFVVRAPVDGVVVDRFVGPADRVAGQYEDGGTELFMIATPP